MTRLASDVDGAQIKRIFDVMRADCPAFKGYSHKDIDDMLLVLKVMQFQNGDCLVQKGEPVDMFAIVIQGRLRVGKKGQYEDEGGRQPRKPITLGFGDMLGHQNLAEVDGEFMSKKWDYDIYAESTGLVALLPFGEYKMETRRNP